VETLQPHEIEGLRGLPGITPAAIDAARAAAAAPPPPARADFEVWDENWETFLFFTSLADQWVKLVVPMTVGGMGGSFTASEIRREGIPAPRIESAARMQRIARSRWPQLFADISAMVRGVLDQDAELRAQRANE
jgi:hypothetical protein